MENRPRYELRPYLVIWNATLGIFSIFGAVRVVPTLIYSAKYNGKEYTLCSSLDTMDVNEFWGCMFTFSKVLELGDTLFVVLRKQKLIFLHWYHHTTVLVYVWYLSPHTPGFAQWFMGMNFTVHSIMYNYYALRAMKFHVPRFISMLITSLQLSQMICGFVLTCMAFQLNLKGVKCGDSYQQIMYGMMMYVSYFVLFANFFYKNYLAGKPKLSNAETSHRKKRS
ncbi:Elongation of very long chain fatty acids protein 6 [Mizuhopecten yessoensis]|uniref:Elongation of very long chain fatty acids protein n=1 Tax=Mizuhopecten yessoensis TaxID=6573 RepID=A0A210QGU6_MIZYE|nr:Elongation of very long chain fatty acids protein 6 [Mizuhopecten yessoensis]